MINFKKGKDIQKFILTVSLGYGLAVFLIGIRQGWQPGWMAAHMLMPPSFLLSATSLLYGVIGVYYHLKGDSKKAKGFLQISVGIVSPKGKTEL